jgi:hypothetical protein
MTKRKPVRAHLMPSIRKLRRNGATTLREIADGLNARRVSTALGGKSSKTTVANLLARL